MRFTWANYNLTNFEFEAHALTGNESYVNLLKLQAKNL